MTDFTISAKVRGLQELQRANLQLIEAVSPRGGLGRGVKAAGLFMLRYARAITHVKTGTLQASHRMDFAQGGVETFFGGRRFRTDVFARIYIDESVRNPFTRQRPHVYGFLEHQRGGSHAFYERAVDEAGDFAIAIVDRELQSSLPRGGRSSIGGRALGLLFSVLGASSG